MHGTYLSLMLRVLLLLPNVGLFSNISAICSAASASTISLEWFIPNDDEEDVYENISARVGDTVNFKWSGNYPHNVFLHPSGDCSEDGAVVLGASSNNGDSSYTFGVEDVGEVTFACDEGYHCEMGQIVTIKVAPFEDSSPLPPSQSTPMPTPSSGPNGSPSPGSNNQCADDGNIRTRRDWDLIDDAEKQLFIEAIEEAIDRGYYQKFLLYHADSKSAMQSHETCAFILWHRRYLLAVENMLRSLSPKYACLTVPFWNIMEHYKDQNGNMCDSIGNCARVVTDLGGFPTGFDERKYANIEADGQLFIGRPLTRLVDDNGERGIVRGNLLEVGIPDSCNYDSVINMFHESESYVDFALALQRGIHDDVHDEIGGFMPTYSSPSDPLFLVWHSFVDLLLFVWEICNVEESEDSFDPFAGSSCTYTTDDAARVFPSLNQTSEMWMKSGNSSIVDDPLIGNYFQDIDLTFKGVSLVNQLGENEFNYDHLTPPLLKFLQNPEVCTHGQWFTASPTQTPPTSPPTKEADQNAFNQWILDIRISLAELYGEDTTMINAQVSFLICTLKGSRRIPSDDFRQAFLDGDLNDQNCNFFLSQVIKDDSPAAPKDQIPSLPKIISIDWFIPNDDEDDAYDNINAKVGDTINFKWSGNYPHNVYRHPSGDCSEDGATEIGASGNNGDSSYTFTSSDVGKVTFACDEGYHCEMGQIVHVNVAVGDPDPAPSLSQRPSYSPIESPSPLDSSSANLSLSKSCYISIQLTIIAMVVYIL